MTQSPCLPLALDERGLLPCPFCGGQAEVERPGSARASNIVACAECGCRLESGDVFDTGASWNRRAISAVPASQAVAALEWKTVGSGDWQAESFIGQYTASFVSKKYTVVLHHMRDGRDAYLILADGVRDHLAAKAAAQADYEARIRSALIAQEPAEGAVLDYAALLRKLELWEATAKASEHRVRFWQDRTEASEARARRMEEALRGLLDCPDIADNDHKDEETHAAERAARAALSDSPAPAEPDGVVNAELLAALIERLRTWGSPKKENARKLMREAAAALSAPSPREGWVTEATHERLREAISDFMVEHVAIPGKSSYGIADEILAAAAAARRRAEREARLRESETRYGRPDIMDQKDADIADLMDRFVTAVERIADALEARP